MRKLEITSQKNGTAVAIVVPNCPENVEEAVETFGEDIVLNMFLRAVVIQFQMCVRTDIVKTGDDKLTDAQIKNRNPKLDPIIGRVAMSPVAKLEAMCGKLGISRKDAVAMLGGAQ